MTSKIDEQTLIPLGVGALAFVSLVSVVFWLSSIANNAEIANARVVELKSTYEKRDEKIMLILDQINEKIHEIDKRIK